MKTLNFGAKISEFTRNCLLHEEYTVDRGWLIVEWVRMIKAWGVEIFGKNGFFK